MRAITLWQPWASLWASGVKVHETRHWPTDYRGPLAIHAAQKLVYAVSPELEDILDSDFGPHWGMELPRGAIVGTCRIVSCRVIGSFPISELHPDDIAAGDHTPGRFAWGAADFRLFKRPIPWKGRQGFFSVPDSALAQG